MEISATRKSSSPFKLMVTDIDNTVFDWVTYYVTAFNALLDHVAATVGSTRQQLALESKQVFEHNGSIEYPFLIQELPTVCKHYGDDLDRLLNACVAPGRDIFLQAAQPVLKPYSDVLATLDTIRAQYPHLPMVALTDAPRYIAMWKLNKLGILKYFDAVYGLVDPKVPVCEENKRIKVDSEILIKHLQQHRFGFSGKIRILPDDYEKPGVRGFKTVLMDYELDESVHDRRHVLWIGDNLRKDIGLGIKMKVFSAWAEYGTLIDSATLASLATFSPTQNIHKNIYLKSGEADAPCSDVTLKSFSDVLTVLAKGCSLSD